MRKHLFVPHRGVSRIIYDCIIILGLVAFAFAGTLCVGQSVDPKPALGQAAPTGPRIWLTESQALRVQHTGATAREQALAQSVAAGKAVPLALAKGDFDGDGYEDLIAGYATPAGGAILLHRGNPDALAAEYSYIRANADNANGGFNLNGASGSFTYNMNDRFSAVVDIGAYRFSSLPSGIDSTIYTYLFGPRFSLRRHGRMVPFAQALVGAGRLNASSSGVKAGENSFAMAWVGDRIFESVRGSPSERSKLSTC